MTKKFCDICGEVAHVCDRFETKIQTDLCVHEKVIVFSLIFYDGYGSFDLCYKCKVKIIKTIFTSV